MQAKEMNCSLKLTTTMEENSTVCMELNKLKTRLYDFKFVMKAPAVFS